MPDSPRYSKRLAPNCEQQAYIIALAEIGDPVLAEQLVTQTLNALGHTLPQREKETDARFFLLLISALIDWRWQNRLWTRPVKRLLRWRSSAPPALPKKLQQLPISRRHGYLLARLAPLSNEQIAAIVELPIAQVRHPAWDTCAGPPSADARSHYRRRLRVLAAELRLLQKTLSPARLQRLQRARKQELSSPATSELQALYFWQRAMQRQLLPTGIVMLLMLAFLLGYILYF